jgi:hypothetical protein
LRGLDFFSVVSEHYGVEEVGLPPDDEVENRFTLDHGDFLRLQHLVNPLHSYGIDLYTATREFVYDAVRQNRVPATAS